MPRITGSGGAMIGGVRTPAYKLAAGKTMVGKPKLSVPVAANTMRPGIPKKSARVRSAHTGGTVVTF